MNGYKYTFNGNLEFAKAVKMQQMIMHQRTCVSNTTWINISEAWRFTYKKSPQIGLFMLNGLAANNYRTSSRKKRSSARLQGAV